MNKYIYTYSIISSFNFVLLIYFASLISTYELGIFSLINSFLIIITQTAKFDGAFLYISKLISKEYPDTSICMSDINFDMLSEGRDRAINESFDSNCSFCQLNGESLPFKNSAFNLITIGFGLRNFTDKGKGLSEMKRCLRKNGKLLILEFSKPINPIFSKIYDWYSFNILPRLGSVLANDSQSYQYLAESIRMHPDQESLKEMILDSGFKDCKFFNLLNGIVTIHIAYND